MNSLLDSGADATLDVVELEVPPSADTAAPESEKSESSEKPAAPELPPIENGTVLSDGEGTDYVVENLTGWSLTLRRRIPKIRGKAARKALKRQRRDLHQREVRSSKFVDVDWNTRQESDCV
jgi:hypothetical protein